MLTKNIFFKNYKLKKNNNKIKKNLEIIIKENNEILQSLSTGYKNSYNKKTISKFKKYFHIRLIGMGGSTLGAESIYNFLKHKIKKNFYFNNNLQSKIKYSVKKNYVNLIISKSGSTLETIANANIIIKKNDKNIFITENRKNYLYLLAKKLKSEIVHHNNFIGGRYSVLSEVGMLPAELMGLNASKFKQLNNLIKNKKFINSLIINVNNTLFFLKKKNLILLFLIMMKVQMLYLSGISN